ncbi:unnamed protein product [Soboliphyme baturini]|uniref:DUF725 domain-containing protein n=1 Tax=Soboliphyme baturini TaxID=241478 RepID=A0A183IA31_9BILA|nr:unnamed protein product [Soboliphyme baturini]
MRNAYEQRYTKEKCEQEVVKAMCFRGALNHIADGLYRYGRQCCVVSQAMRDLSALIPNVEANELLYTDYRGSGPSRHCVEQARLAIAQLDNDGRVLGNCRVSPPIGDQRTSCSFSDAPPPYAP